MDTTEPKEEKKRLPTGKFLIIRDMVIYSRFLVKLYLHNVKNPKNFFFAIIKGFIDHDPDLERFAEKKLYPTLKPNSTKKLRAEVAKEVINKNLQENLQKFGLEQSEIENIFDIIESDYRFGK